jgi:hypothetical protein
LGLLGIKNSVERIAPREFEMPSTMAIARNYLAMLFADRMQDDDYSPPASCRYPHTIFPPIARDLAEAFELYPHFEICAVVLATFAHLHALETRRGQQCFSLAQWLLFREVAGDNLATAREDAEHLEHIWRRYLDDGESGLTWSMVAQSLEATARISWADHPGFRDLLCLWREDASVGSRPGTQLPDHLKHVELWRKCGKPIDPVIDPFTETCPNVNCPRHTHIDPRLRILREMRPVICAACGRLLVPVDLLNEFMARQHGQVS